MRKSPSLSLIQSPSRPRMAASPLRSKALQHGRSLSLPSKLHPALSRSNENLARIRASEPPCSSFSSMGKSLSSLRNLYCNIDDMLVLPYIQDIIAKECEEEWFDQILDGYIRLLDACSTAKDILSQTKHDIQELLSALRRRDVRGNDCYHTSRRNSKKVIQKSLKYLRSFRSANVNLSLEKNQETWALICALHESEAFTITMFESLLSYLLGAKVQSRQSGWSLVSKLMFSKRVSYQGEESNVNEFKRLDSFLQLSQEDDAIFEELMNHLKEMDSSIRVLEEELELLFRQLIKTRVFLLNILNH